MALKDNPTATTVAIAVAAVVVMVGATEVVPRFLNRSTATQDVVLQLETQIKAIEREIARNAEHIERNTQWQTDWQRNGELPMDRDQNAAINRIDRELTRLETAMNAMQKRITDIRIAMGRDPRDIAK